MTITIKHSLEWEVWVQMEDGDPIDQRESFVIGVGDTQLAAVRAAKRELRDVYAELEKLEQ